MFKRIFLFLLTNVLVLITISVIIFLLERFLWIKISWYWTNYVSVLIYAWIIWFTWAFISLRISRWIAKKTYWINLIEENNLFNYSEKERFVFQIVKNISTLKSIKIPEVWIYESEESNAFATWPSKNKSLVAVSTWLLQNMTNDEIEWVIAHEMAHILNWDMVTMTLLQWIINTFVIFLSRILSTLIENYFRSSDDESEWAGWIYFVSTIVLDLIFSVLASIAIMAYSRKREFAADLWSAKLAWKDKMIKALRKLQNMQEIMTTSSLDKASTFNIWSKEVWWFMALFSSHPKLEDRIKSLENNYTI